MPDPTAIHLSVVVPVYNEEKIILETVRRLRAHFSLRPWRAEILVVDDGSTDRTVELLKSAGADPVSELVVLTAKMNSGKGFAARRGALAARGRYVLLTDADLSTPIKEVDKLIAVLEGGQDVAIGSRALRERGCDVQQSLKRHVSGRIFNFFVRILVLKGFRDTQCGFKCFKKAAAVALFNRQKLDGFAFDVELLYLARKHGYFVKEVPVMWKQGADSRVSLLRDSTRMVGDLFKIRRLHI
jgi:dolichyl-phosphate beta-glucosyltransferase